MAGGFRLGPALFLFCVCVCVSVLVIVFSDRMKILEVLKKVSVQTSDGCLLSSERLQMDSGAKKST